MLHPDIVYTKIKKTIYSLENTKQARNVMYMLKNWRQQDEKLMEEMVSHWFWKYFFSFEKLAENVKKRNFLWDLFKKRLDDLNKA